MDVLLLGVGPVGIEYARILQALGHKVVAIGRSEQGCRSFEEATGIAALAGGVDAFVASGAAFPQRAIVAVSEAQLGSVSRQLNSLGVMSLLVEKPGGADAADIRELADSVERTGADVRVAYNRRFHASTLAAQRLIEEDGGVTSFTFEFTEWSHRIEPLTKEPGVKEQWFLQNSSHVVDLAFHIGGWPIEMVGYAAGELSWHPHARYAGAGLSRSGALFSYFADWQAPGRWALEFMTRKRRFVFRPMETLQTQSIGSVAIESIEIDDTLDREYKPGFFLQTKAFLEEPTILLSIHEQVEHLDTYSRIQPES